jgi:hypothetical protein
MCKCYSSVRKSTLRSKRIIDIRAHVLYIDSNMVSNSAKQAGPGARDQETSTPLVSPSDAARCSSFSCHRLHGLHRSPRPLSLASSCVVGPDRWMGDIGKEGAKGVGGEDGVLPHHCRHHSSSPERLVPGPESLIVGLRRDDHKLPMPSPTGPGHGQGPG